MTPEQFIEQKTGKGSFHQNHPILDALDYSDVRDLMQAYAEQQKEAWQREAWIAARKLSRTKFAEREYKTFNQWKEEQQ